MKRLLLVLFFVPLISFSQTKDAFELCYSFQQNFNQFDSNFEANDVLERILYVTGATPNFVLMECDKISNAIAVTYKGQRYILYDKEFMSLISKNTSSWSNTFILAHEVGHHINGHTKDLALGSILSEQELEQQRQEELDADYYAGFVLAKLGASLSQANAAVNLVSSDSDDRYSTHPDRNKRIAAITRGWNVGIDKPVSKGNNNSKPIRISKPSSWVQYKPEKNNPFDKERAYAYTIGNILPVKVSTSKIKPKLIIKKKCPGGYPENLGCIWEGRIHLSDFIDMKSNDFKVSYKITQVAIKNPTSVNPSSASEYYVTNKFTGEEMRLRYKSFQDEFLSNGNYHKPREVIYEDVARDKIVGLDKIVENELNSNKVEFYNHILKRSKLHDENYYDRYGKYGNKIYFEGVFDNEERTYSFRTEKFYEIDFFNSKESYSLYCSDNCDREVKLFKSKNKFFLKPIRVENNFAGDYELYIQVPEYSLYVKIDATLESIYPDELFDGKSYFEFDLNGSTKALSFD